jgi:hypothetical protein
MHEPPIADAVEIIDAALAEFRGRGNPGRLSSRRGRGQLEGCPHSPKQPPAAARPPMSPWRSVRPSPRWGSEPPRRATPR